MGRFPRRAIVISLLLPVLGTLLTGGIGVGILVSWYGHSDRATTVVTGRGDAVTGFSGNETMIESVDVWWEDAAGDGHEAEFRVPEGSQLPQTRPFQIRYDPADPEGLAFPAGADASLVIAPQPPWWVLLFAAPFLLLTVGIIWGWWSRIRAARTAAAQPGVRYRVVPFAIRGTTGALGSTKELDVGLGTLLLPADDPFDEDTFSTGRPLVNPPGSRWQRTMWSPGFACLTPGQEVTAHVGDGKDGRAVLVTADGPVWPTGPLRDNSLPRRQQVRVALRSPVNSRIRPGKAYLVAPLFGLCAAPAAFRSPGTLLLLPLAVLLGYSLGIFAWAWRGGIPGER
jgi:hypothetical protein